VCTTAASNGHYDCLKYVHQKGYQWNKTCTQAAFNGQLPCLKYAVENGCPVTKDAMNGAAKSGNLDCIKNLQAA